MSRSTLSVQQRAREIACPLAFLFEAMVDRPLRGRFPAERCEQRGSPSQGRAKAKSAHRAFTNYSARVGLLVPIAQRVPFGCGELRINRRDVVGPGQNGATNSATLFSFASGANDASLRKSRGEPINQPCGVALTRVTKSVVEPIWPSLPEFELIRLKSIATPMRR